ncbi:aminotransferase class V-fold PLP-dependent enzyme [Lacunimicrobium album]
MAAELAATLWSSRADHAATLKAKLMDQLNGLNAVVNGDQRRCQPHVLNVSFPGVDSEAFMMATREQIAVSNGSACTSTSYSSSHVLLAMELDDDRIESAIRISWGPGVQEIPAEAIVNVVKSLQM